MDHKEARGFITVACQGHFVEVFSEIVNTLLESRLYEASQSINLALTGYPAHRQRAKELIAPFARFRVQYESDDLSEYEYPGLGLLQDFCHDNQTGYVYYLHTKGVSREPLNQYARYWRRLMLHYVVEDHAQCTRALVDHDAAGTNWRSNHYSGNFWWARVEHVRKLPDVRRLRLRPKHLSADPIWNTRLQCEFWIGMAPGRFKNFGPAGRDLYSSIHWGKGADFVIERLLDAQGGSRYLELAMDGPGTWVAKVNAQVKHLVSPHPSATFAMGEQAFIESGLGRERYDLVVIDSTHDERRCLSAIEWALTRLDDRGALLVHDSNPPTKWHQRPSSEYSPGSEWNGDVWKAIVRFRLSHPEIDVFTVDTDWGCTIIQPGRSTARPTSLGPAIAQRLTWEDFEVNREEWLKLITVNRFVRGLHCEPWIRGRVPLVSRTDLLNALISRYDLQRYLEIGIGADGNFERIIAPIRQSLNVGRFPTFRMASDAFFAGNVGCPSYDLVFIDGLHLEQQCLRDVENAIRRLAPGGFIVVHGANPPTERHQRPLDALEPGLESCGTVWRAVLRVRSRHPDCAVFTVDVDSGCAVIVPPAVPLPSTEREPPPDTLSWTELARHRRQLLTLVSPAVFCRWLNEDNPPVGDERPARVARAIIQLSAEAST